MKYVEILRLVVAMLPTIIDAVKAIEAAIPESGKGAAKLAAVRTLLESIYSISGETVVVFGQLWPALEKIIGGVVGALNAAGIFKPAANAPAVSG